MNPKHPESDNYIDDEEDEFEWGDEALKEIRGVVGASVPPYRARTVVA